MSAHSSSMVTARPDSLSPGSSQQLRLELKPKPARGRQTLGRCAKRPDAMLRPGARARANGSPHLDVEKYGKARALEAAGSRAENEVNEILTWELWAAAALRTRGHESFRPHTLDCSE
ncbi:hypothetical protein LZ30DRAFT_54833 [Colletotrichum cereale]|nr:hypothetical protein LZ30DRAFT_54833 [Colletotrichum cereale]